VIEMHDKQHQHAAFEVLADSPGHPVDRALLGSLLGAAYDSCLGCQDGLLTQLGEDPATTVRLVEMACVAIHHPFAGLPLSIVNEQAPGPAAAEFRCLVHAGLDGALSAMRAECERMTSAQRRAAASAAVDLLISQLM
jgi:hypothetical protein